MKSLQVLVVDDSLITVKKLAGMLSLLGHKVVMSAGTGKEALAAYESCRPDLVTMDITMPDMDGIEATRLIRARFPDALIIMITSHGQEKMVLDALKAGAKGYLIKPFRQEKMQEAIEAAVKRNIQPGKRQEAVAAFAKPDIRQDKAQDVVEASAKRDIREDKPEEAVEASAKSDIQKNKPEEVDETKDDS